jgi:hypothetical protein
MLYSTKRWTEIMSNDAKWHWAEGNKYVVEGAKSIFLLNGVAAISVLTFIGHLKTHSHSLIAAMGLFAIGALFSALIFMFAYFAQLYYGNGDRGPAITWHHRTYWAVGISVIAFIAGLACAGYGFAALP